MTSNNIYHDPVIQFSQVKDRKWFNKFRIQNVKGSKVYSENFLSLLPTSRPVQPPHYHPLCLT